MIAESLPLICAAYAEAPYSFARPRAVVALCPHAGHEVVQELMVESPWDCEAESRVVTDPLARIANDSVVER